MKNVDLNKYKDFVQEVTSEQSNNTDALTTTLKELGDIAWYWVNSCRALGLDPNDVLEENVNKLKSRYPGGEFDVHYSENRKDGDL